MHVSSLCSFLSDNALQMAKRVPQSPDVDGATAAFKRVSLGAPTTQLRTHSAGPPFRSGSAFSSGMAARRNKPLFKLSDITGEQESGGGAAGAGSAVGVPDETEWPPRRTVAVTSTPFANFGKIVYALLVMVELFPPHFFFSDPSGALNFSGKAILHSSGVDFSNGSSFVINMDQLQLGEELGSGAYGTVKRVIHRPTNATMAMKVGPFFNLHDHCPADLQTRFAGNSFRTRRYQVECDHHGA
jgi:mitogen-activated protein kinase kinase